MIKKTVMILSILSIFNACTQTIKKQESAFIVIKTPSFKYADMGFISDFHSKIKVDIYAAGQPLMNFEINGMNICMSTFECMNKKAFNKKVLSSAYPDELLENIFRAEPIFNGENLEREGEVFSQKLSKDGLYDISYSVNSKERIFRDKLNKILIKVREE